MLSKSTFAKTFATFQNFYSFFQMNLQQIIQSQLVFILIVAIQSISHHYLIVAHYPVNVTLFHGYPAYSSTFYICTYVTSYVRTFQIHFHSSTDLSDMINHIYSYLRVDVYSLLYGLHQYNVIVWLPEHSKVRYIRMIPFEYENDDFQH